MALREAGVRYLVVGGMAVVAHGYGRLTVDIDLFVDLEENNIKAALGALAGLGFQPRVPVTAEQFADRKTRERWSGEKGMRVLNLYSDQHRETPVDIFVYEPLPFAEVMGRAVSVELEEGLSIAFVSIGDLIAMKEGTGRAKDLDDIEHLREIGNEEGY